MRWMRDGAWREYRDIVTPLRLFFYIFLVFFFLRVSGPHTCPKATPRRLAMFGRWIFHLQGMKRAVEKADSVEEDGEEFGTILRFEHGRVVHLPGVFLKALSWA